MKKIYFATTNKGKLNEASSILGIEMEATPYEVDEIQSLDPIKVATTKVRSYYKKLKSPLLVEDISLTFSALRRLPGTYIDDFMESLGNKGLINLLKSHQNKNAVAQTTIVFVDEEGKEQVFIGKVYGTISEKPRGKKGFGWDPIFIPKGFKKTFAEMSMEEKNKISMRATALKKFKKWLISTDRC